MASRGPSEGAPKPEVGDTLIVIREYALAFVARCL